MPLKTTPLAGHIQFARPKVAAAITPAAPKAPASRACCGLPPSLVLTTKVPRIEQMIPAAAINRGRRTGLIASASLNAPPPTAAAPRPSTIVPIIAPT